MGIACMQKRCVSYNVSKNLSKKISIFYYHGVCIFTLFPSILFIKRKEKRKEKKEKEGKEKKSLKEEEKGMIVFLGNIYFARKENSSGRQ